MYMYKNQDLEEETFADTVHTMPEAVTTVQTACS